MNVFALSHKDSESHIAIPLPPYQDPGKDTILIMVRRFASRMQKSQVVNDKEVPLLPVDSHNATGSDRLSYDVVDDSSSSGNRLHARLIDSETQAIFPFCSNGA